MQPFIARFRGGVHRDRSRGLGRRRRTRVGHLAGQIVNGNTSSVRDRTDGASHAKQPPRVVSSISQRDLS